jgi:ribonuclease HII
MNLDLAFPYKSIIKGDTKSKSIAAASILAKVIRDRIMFKYDKIYPAYGFKRHKGYPTKEHRDILGKIGPSLIHRKSFSCV